MTRNEPETETEPETEPDPSHDPEPDEPSPLVRADRERCLGAGMCVLTAPEVFDQDTEDGLVVLLRTRLPRADTEAVREAVGLCPSEAITLA